MKNLVKALVGERVVWAFRYLFYPKKYAVVGAPLTYDKDGLATQHNSDSLQDPKFQKAYQLGRETGSFAGSWGSVDPEYRAYTYCWAAYQCRNLEGDYIECGVNKGGMARAAMHYMGFSTNDNRNFYLLDTYEGTPEKFLNDEERRTHNVYDECYEAVVANFKAFSNVKIVRGEVPGTLDHVTSEKIAFLSLDMNCVEPEIAAADFFWPKLSVGGVIVLDDYNNIGHERQKHAFDEFCEKRNIKVLGLPTGQGLIFKSYE